MSILEGIAAELLQDLPDADPVGENDLLPIGQGPTALRKAKIKDVRAALLGGASNMATATAAAYTAAGYATEQGQAAETAASQLNVALGQVESATLGANNAAALALDRAGQAETQADAAEQAADAANSGAGAANAAAASATAAAGNADAKATLADQKATLANTKAGLADAAATAASAAASDAADAAVAANNAAGSINDALDDVTAATSAATSAATNANAKATLADNAAAAAIAAAADAQDVADTIDAALAGKADTSAVNAALALKADATALASGLAANATADRARANHTGTQAISTVSGLQSALDAKVATTTLGGAGGGDMVGLAEGGKLKDAIPYITPQQKGGSWDVDSTAALEDTLLGIINTDQPAMINKVIKVDGAIESAANVSLQGTGLIDLSGGGTLKFGTGVTALPNLAANIALFASQMTFASAHGLAVGDVVAIWNPTDFSQAAYRDIYRAGDMFKVSKVVSSTVVQFFGVARSAFASADVLAFKLNGGKFSWDGIGIIPPSTGIPLQLDGLVDVNLNRPLIYPGVDGTGIDIFRCYGTMITAPRIINLTESDGYPIAIANSQNGVFNGANQVNSGWHCFLFGGRDGDATVPVADWTVANVIAMNRAGSGVGSLESHGGCKRITFDGFQTDVLNVSGEDMTYRNGTVYGRDPALFADGGCMYGAEVVGGTFLFENVRAISAGGNSSFATHLELGAAERTKPLRVIGRSLTFENIGSLSASARVAYINPGEAVNANTIDVHIDGLDYIAPSAPITLIGINNTQDISALATIRLDNVTGNINQVLASTNSANLNIPLSGNFRGELTGYASRGQLNTTLAADRALTTTTFSAKVNNWDASFGTNRTVTLSTTRAKAGDTFRCIRTGGNSGGPFNLDVGGLKTLAQGQWCDVTYTGSAWALSAFGSL